MQISVIRLWLITVIIINVHVLINLPLQDWWKWEILEGEIRERHHRTSGGLDRFLHQLSERLSDQRVQEAAETCNVTIPQLQLLQFHHF